MENEIEEKVRASAKAKNISLSKWIGRLIREKTADEWPETVKQLAGAWRNFAEIEDIRSGTVDDIPRESF